MPEGAEALRTAGLGLQGIDGEALMAAPARMADIIGATADGARIQSINQIHHQWGMHRNGRMQATGRLPGTVAYSGDKGAGLPGGSQWQFDPIDGDGMTLLIQAGHFDLQAFE